LAHVEGCKHALEITIPLAEVEAETEKVVASIQKKVKLPGFRPGKVPLDIIRKRFESDIRQEVVENLVPRHFRQEAERDRLQIVGNPNITDVHFHAGEPIRFKAEFEVAPDFDLGDYLDVEVTYEEPAVTDSDVEQRIETLRHNKADYVNEDPRPVQDGDYAVVALESLSGVEGAPIKQDEVMLHVGAEETVAAFSESLRGMNPGDDKEIEVAYPEDYGQERLAGKTVRFRMALKGIRRQELPEVNDEFAKDLGDFQNLEELRDAVRKSIVAEREYEAKQKAINSLVDKLVESHEFPVPEAYIERQIENQVEDYLRGMAARGADLKNLRLNWDKVKEATRPRAVRDVKAALVLGKIADREAIETTNDEMDREVGRIARQDREPVAAVRKRLQERGELGRIAHRIRTDKTLNFLFEKARKVASE
jgi:trigger factor